VATLVLVIASALIAPRVVYRMLGDGGFERYGYPIKLGDWPGLRTGRNDQAPIPVDAVTLENGVKHRDYWVNTGQWIGFRKVPATGHSMLTCQVRIHPAWSAGGTARFRLQARDRSGQMISSEVDYVADANAPWREASLDLAPLAGREVEIKIIPMSPAPGVWTLLRDPRIDIVDRASPAP